VPGFTAQALLLELELLLELLELLELLVLLVFDEFDDVFDEFDEFEVFDEFDVLFPASGSGDPPFFDDDEHASRPMSPVATTKAPSTPIRKKFMKSSCKLSPPNCCGASKP
jgi:hypothetical protein